MDVFVFTSVNIQVNFFSLENWLNKSLIVNFSSWSDNGFKSIIFSNNWFFWNRLKIDNFIILRNKFNVFFIINNHFFIDWLIVYFSRRGLILFIDNFFTILNRSDYFLMINNFRFFLLKIDDFFDNFFIWLNVSFSNSCGSWNWNWYISAKTLIVNNCRLSNLFGVNRSLNICSSYNRGLNNLLSNDRLWNDFSSDNWLRNNFLLNQWCRNDFCSLTNLRFRIIDLLSVFHFSFSF